MTKVQATYLDDIDHVPFTVERFDFDQQKAMWYFRGHLPNHEDFKDLLFILPDARKIRGDHEDIVSILRQYTI